MEKWYIMEERTDENEKWYRETKKQKRPTMYKKKRPLV